MFATTKTIVDLHIRKKMGDLKHDYCDDKIGNKEYLQGLKSLPESSKNPVTRSQIEYLIIEVEGSIRRNGD